MQSLDVRIFLPEGGQPSLILRPSVFVRQPQRTTECEAQCSDEIPECNPPAQQSGIRFPPLLLRLQQVQRATHDEATPTDDLRNPVGSIDLPLRRSQVIVDSGKRREPRDAKDSGAKELGATGQEAKFVEVMCA